MEIKLSRKSQDASIVVGVFILLMLLLFFGGFLTFGCRAKKIKPRQLPAEDTNAVNIIQMPWFALLAPTPQAEPSGSRIAPLPLISFTNELTFPWYPGLNGWLLIWRTPNWQNYEMMNYILYEDGDRYRTNNGEIFQVIGFVDLYPLPEQAFYEGVIITNR